MAGEGGSGVRRRGLMLILSSPSGAGKTTISRALLDRDSNLVMSVSCTTRPPRPGEVNGKDYTFVDMKTFDAMVKDNGFLEHATVFENKYGTPRKPVEEALAIGQDVLFDVDWQGAQQLGHSAGNDVVSIFILPPSTTELERRLRSRAQDADDVVKKRMAKASDEMSHWDAYHYIIVNHDVEASIAQAQAILAAERLRRDRQVGLTAFVNELRGLKD